MRHNGLDYASTQLVAAEAVKKDPDEITIEAGRPPNFATICKLFPASAGKGTIFTYGRVIYVSDGSKLPRSLIAHEVIHVQQQDVMGRDEWWDRYLHDQQFRFGQELSAHRAEYGVACTEGGRTHRRVALAKIAQRLAGPLYGRCTTLAKAKALIREAAND